MGWLMCPRGTVPVAWVGFSPWGGARIWGDQLWAEAVAQGWGAGGEGGDGGSPAPGVGSTGTCRELD